MVPNPANLREGVKRRMCSMAGLVRSGLRGKHQARERGGHPPAGCRVHEGWPKRFGRPSKLTKHQKEQALKLLDAGEPQSAVARLLNVDQSTISRLAARAAGLTAA